VTSPPDLEFLSCRKEADRDHRFGVGFPPWGRPSLRDLAGDAARSVDESVDL
jgi:hypothetical protein